jgi:hypothetical protein
MGDGTMMNDSALLGDVRLQAARSMIKGDDTRRWKMLPRRSARRK